MRALQLDDLPAHEEAVEDERQSYHEGMKPATQMLLINRLVRRVLAAAVDGHPDDVEEEHDGDAVLDTMTPALISFVALYLGGTPRWRSISPPPLALGLRHNISATHVRSVELVVGLARRDDLAHP